MRTVAEEKFNKFHKENPQVYKILVHLTEKAYANGREKIGIKMLFEVFRWEVLVSTNDPEFKINNNYAPYYARLIMQENPRFGEMFETREIRT
jgi:hypothetical protein